MHAFDPTLTSVRRFATHDPMHHLLHRSLSSLRVYNVFVVDHQLILGFVELAASTEHRESRIAYGNGNGEKPADGKRTKKDRRESRTN